MILRASEDGFVDCVAALCDFNLTEKAKGIPKTRLVRCWRMRSSATLGYGKIRPQAVPQASFVGIAGAGHFTYGRAIGSLRQGNP
jgi:hypothetical protein